MVIIVFIAKATEARGERPGWSQRKGLESFKQGGAHDQSFQKLLWLLYIESSRDSLEAESPSTEGRVGDLDWGSGHGVVGAV